MMASGLVVQQAVYGQVEQNLGPGQSQENNIGPNNPGVNSTQSIFPIPLSMVSVYKDSIGGVHIVGQVQNNFTFPVSHVQVVVTLYNPNRQVVSTGNAYTDVNFLKPGEKSGFAVIATNVPSDARGYSLSASYQQASSSKPPALSLSLGSHNLDIINSYHLLGEVTNLGNITASFVKISAVFFDANHKVVDAVFGYTNPSDLQQGQKAPFDLQSSSPKARDIKYASVNVESNEYSLSPNNQPTPLTTSPTTPLASSNPTSGLIPLGSTTGSSHTGSNHHNSHQHQEGSGGGSPGPSGARGNGTTSNKTK
jgi:hypothetical protein